MAVHLAPVSDAPLLVGLCPAQGAAALPSIPANDSNNCVWVGQEVSHCNPGATCWQVLKCSLVECLKHWK